MTTIFKVTMVNGKGEVVGFCAKRAGSPEEAMRLAEHDYRDFAAYTAEILQPFDYSCAGGMMAAYNH